MMTPPSRPIARARSTSGRSIAPRLRVRFAWGMPARDEGRWRLGAYCFYRRYPDGVRGPDPMFPLTKKKGVLCLKISVRGVLIWCLALGLVAYFAGALALLRWYQQMPHNQIVYADLVVPERWSQVAVLRGEALIIDAYEDLKGGRFQAGFAKLRAGVERNPTNAKARLDLARIYVSIRLRPAGERLLFEAFHHGYPGGEFVHDGVALITEGDNPEQAVLFCEKALDAAKRGGGTPAELRAIDGLYVRALVAADRDQEAVARVRARLPVDDAFGREVIIRHLLRTRAHAEAVAEVETWGTRPGSPPEALRLAVDVYREAGRLTEMEAALARLRARVGGSAEFAAYEVIQHVLAGRPTRAEAAVEDFLFRYGANGRHPVLLATLLGERGEAGLILRVEEDARGRGMPTGRLRLARLQALIARQEWAAACAVAELLEDGKQRLSADEVAVLRSLGSLARACRDGASGAKSGLVDAIAKRPGSLKLYRTVIESLLSAGQHPTALLVLSFGEGRFPESRYLAGARKRLEALAEADAIAEEKTSARKQETPLLSDMGALLKAVAELEKGGQREEALTLIRKHRRGMAGVFTENHPELALCEVRLAAEEGDVPALQFYVREHLKTGALTAGQAVTLAKTWDGEGRGTEAKLMVREVLKRDPGDQIALKLWAEWVPLPDPDETQSTGGEAKTSVERAGR